MLRLTPDLLTNVELIDSQHQELVAAMNKLRVQRPDEIGESLDFLISYVERHFKDEEDLMSAHGYPVLELHQNQHKLFSNKMSNYKTIFKESSDPERIQKEIISFLDTWLVSHIKNSDMGFAKYYYSKS